MNENGTLASRTPIVSVAVSRTRFSVSLRSAAAGSGGGAATATVVGFAAKAPPVKANAATSAASVDRERRRMSMTAYGSKTDASGITGGRPVRRLLQLAFRQLDVEALHRVGRLGSRGGLVEPGRIV